MFRKLTLLGLSQEQMAGVLEVFNEVEAADEHRRSMQRERWHRWREKKSLTLDKRELTLANDSRAPAGGLDNLLKEEITGQKKKKEKKDKPSQMAVVRSELLLVLDEDHADALIEHRKGMRHALTPRAASLIAKKLDACPDANEAVDAMIANGWRGIEAAWLRKGGQRRTRIEDDLDFISKNFSTGEDNGREISRNALSNVDAVPAKSGRKH